MNDQNKHYWKESYRDSWAASSSKEEFIKALIEQNTGLLLQAYGLGAGSEEFIAGNATDNSLRKGDADFHIEAIDAYIEVTGPMIPMSVTADLWVRPDKLRNALDKRSIGQGQIHSVFHLLEEKGTTNKVIRVVILDDEFYKERNFRSVEPIINRRQERYIAIPYNSRAVISFESYLEILNGLRDRLQ